MIFPASQLQASQKGPLSDPKKLLDDLFEFDKAWPVTLDKGAEYQLIHVDRRAILTSTCNMLVENEVTGSPAKIADSSDFLRLIIISPAKVT